MKDRLLWAATALLSTTLGIPAISYAQVKPSIPQGYPVSGLQGASTNAQGIYTQQSFPSRIARIQPLQLGGRMAATLIVNNVPVLTFVGTTPMSSSSQSATNQQFQLLNEPILRATSVANQINQLYANNIDANTIKAVWQPAGSSVKSVGVNKSKKATKTQTQRGRYAITVQDQVLVEIDSTTRLPDTISDPAKDALQATNRLRSLLGNAPPLEEISGKPGKKVSLPTDRLLASTPFANPTVNPAYNPTVNPTVNPAYNPTVNPAYNPAYNPAVNPLGIPPFSNLNVAYSDSGLASWYSFRDNGFATASGEPYNEMDMTAAHRTLPFGTLVRVTNLQNFQSVIVRITDRGPYIQGRIIDLSTGAAHTIGMIESGVVPVQLDILTATRNNKFGLGN